jgi:antitoxin component of MazEF toxin-antitoxin module
MLAKVVNARNGYALVFDSELVRMTGMRIGDKVRISKRKDGAIVISPVRRSNSAGKARKSAG